MKIKNRLISGMLALGLTFGSLISLMGCAKEAEETTTPEVLEQEQTTPEVDTNEEEVPEIEEPEEQTTEPQIEPSIISAVDAKSIVDEKMPEGFASSEAQMLIVDDVQYYLFDVQDDLQSVIGMIAVDGISGVRYSYDGEAINDYSTFPLYDAQIDAVCDWNGIFIYEDITIELLQADANSFEYYYSDDTMGYARVRGNTATDINNGITFLMENENTLYICSDNTDYSGSYIK